MYVSGTGGGTEVRSYEETHPWLRFTVDLKAASPNLWLLLGEAQSKCQHIAGVPLLPGVAEQLYQLFLAKGVLATTAIEGNTLSEPQVLELLRGQLELPASKEYLRQEVDNIIEACNSIGDAVLGGDEGRINCEDIKEYNFLVLDGLPLDEGVIPGDIRTYDVGVGGYKAPRAEECEYLLERLCVMLNEEMGAPGTLVDYRLGIGVLRAIVAHLYIAWIHPFGDGNGRTARLLEFRILLAAGVPATAAHLLSNHYNQTRAEYYRQLDTAHRSRGDILPFIEYALRGFVEGLREQMDTIQEQQQTVHWINYVHERFRDKDSPAQIRRRRLAIDLSLRAGPVPIQDISQITPRIAAGYAGLSEKTIRRDVRELERMELVAVTPEGARARPEAMRAFLPPTRPAEK